MKKLILLSSVIAILVSSCSKKECVVWVASPWQQVLRNTPPGDVKSVNLQAASNEYEPFRLILHNVSDKTLENITVSVSDLKNGDNEISSGNIKLYRAHYLHITEPSHRTDNPVGYYPDALIPFSELNSDEKAENIIYPSSPFNVDTCRNAEVWCDLFVPSGTVPGIYEGKVTVYKDKKKLLKIPVHLSVWDFELPEEISMDSHFGHFREKSAMMMGIEKDSDEFLQMEKLYNKELLDHRAVPSTPNNIWPEWSENEGIIDRGESESLIEFIEVHKANAIQIPFRYKDDPEKCKAYLAATADWLRNLGYLDIAYIYLEDEPNNAEEYEIVRKQGELIRSADPGIRRMCTEQTITSNPEWGTLYGAVDIWCPLWGLWNEPTANERLEKGEELWSYTALCQGHEATPWWQIDTDPLNFRSPFWLSWYYDITGYLYWSSTYWDAYETLQGVWEAPHFRKKFWGEGMLLYPGQPAGVNSFVPSIRLKLYREAMEDYEYMVMAANLGKEEEVDKIVNGIVSSFQNWSHDRDAYKIARKNLADLILDK